MPEFPPKEGVIYQEWEKILDTYDLGENNILIAHSIGNEFMIKYLQKHKKKIKLYIGLAGFADYFESKDKPDLNKACQEFLATQEEKENFINLVETKYAIYSDNDHIVPREILKQYAKHIKAIPIEIERIGHMGKKSGLEKLPKIIEIIKEEK